MNETGTILFVSGSLVRGGAQRVLTMLANKYAAKGWTVHIAVLLADEIGYPLADTIYIHKIVRSGNQIKNTPAWISYIRKIMREITPDVVISFAGRINIMTMLAARGTGIPVLVSERNDPARDRRSKPEQWLCKQFYKRADKVDFQTKYQARYYEKWCKNNSVIIGNPISAPVYTGEHKCKDIICVGKLMDQKNHPMMIHAFRQIADEFPDRSVYIFGEGKKRAALGALVKECGLEERVFLPGNSDHIFDIMHENEFFVMCSDYEGLSNALLEAMISGMVCVSTAWNGVEEVVRDGVNGYLTPVGDAELLAVKLRQVLRADNEAIRKHGIETAKQFTGDQIMEQWVSVIDGLAGRSK